ncbi:MAG: hypothetical protein LBE49_06095, partial [Deltaproteobacteria bacterium]|nr:hypothetical protein [Deltaproteobacteria bacterium]
TQVKAGTVIGPVKATVAVEVAMQKGVSLARSDSGAYQLAVKSELSGGVGAGISALEGAIEASVGLSAKGTGCMVLEFKSRDDAAAFLQKMTDKTFSPEDLYRHCQNIQVTDASGIGVALAAQAELGKIKVLDNTPVSGEALFTAGFEASRHVERQVETDTAAQTVATTTTARGRLALSVSVGKAETEDPNAPKEEINLDEDFGAEASMEMAAESNLEVGAQTRKIFGKGVVLNASGGYDDGKVKVELSVTAARSSTVTRSTRSDAAGRLEGASHNVALEFTGPYAQTQFERYMLGNLNASPAAIQSMLIDIQNNGTPFTMEANLALKPDVAERCRMLEGSESTAGEAADLLQNGDNYELSNVKLTFAGREESLAGRGVDINLAAARISVQREARAGESIAVQYSAENGVLSASPSALPSA